MRTTHFIYLMAPVDCVLMCFICSVYINHLASVLRCEKIQNWKMWTLYIFLLSGRNSCSYMCRIYVWDPLRGTESTLYSPYLLWETFPYDSLLTKGLHFFAFSALQSCSIWCFTILLVHLLSTFCSSTFVRRATVC